MNYEQKSYWFLFLSNLIRTEMELYFVVLTYVLVLCSVLIFIKDSVMQ